MSNAAGTDAIDHSAADDFRAVEMAWLQAHAGELAQLYPGEWIAIDGAQLVAHAGDLATAMRIAAEAGHPHPFVTALPAADAPRYFVSAGRTCQCGSATGVGCLYGQHQWYSPVAGSIARSGPRRHTVT
jgi:hypothetical protein